MKKYILYVLFILLLPNISAIYAINKEIEQYTATERPWLWWYWMGSAVTPEGIDWHLQQFRDMGYGGVSIAATYGVDGNEKSNIPFMSPKWIDMLNSTASCFEQSGLRVDASLTSAWPFGGPNVTPDMAAQTSVVRRIFSAGPKEKVNISIEGMQKGRISALSAYNESGDYIELTPFISDKGILNYQFPDCKWDIYGIFSLPTNQRTKRSGEGGEGLVLDHFSKEAVTTYLQRYDSLFLTPSRLRATFNDSYEVYGADYSPVFLDEFQKRRGYDLRRYLYLLSPDDITDAGRRVLCDYRETISDLLLDNFVSVWSAWANKHGVQTVEQAHGSPANWLDLYAAADIPQTESFGASPLNIKNVRIDPLYNEKSFGRPDKMLLKFASSASHVTGKKLTSSESATWLGDHFKVALSQVKPQIDELFISGINHIMLTCGAYSPQEVPFPGWHFYPAADFGHTTALKEYMPDFSLFVARSQHLLQNSRPDNDVLLYVPMHDLWTECNDEDGRSKLMMFTIHNPDNWFYRQDIGDIARTLKREGFDFDYISDRQILSSSPKNGEIETEGGARYKTIVIPCCKRIPLSTLNQLEKLADSGIHIVFAYRLPRDIPGYSEVGERRMQFNEVINRLRNNPFVKVNADYVNALKQIHINNETFGQHHLEYIRKKNDKGVFYFVANQSNTFNEGWIQLAYPVQKAVLFDPLTGKQGLAKIENGKIFLQLQPSESCFIKLYDDNIVQPWNYFHRTSAFVLEGDWNLSFKEGNPTIPDPYLQEQIGSWTAIPDTMALYFSGTGVYEKTFDLPKFDATKYKLMLGDVRDAAKIWVNDIYIGNLWSVPYEIGISSDVLKKRGNKLRIEVRNLDANRLIWLEKQKVPWKTFFIVDVAYRNFNAGNWESVPSGILGPVELKCGK